MRILLSTWRVRGPESGRAPDRLNLDPCRSGRSERAGTSVGGGTGGQHVVDEEDASPGNAVGAGDDEGVAQVVTPGAAAEGALLRRVPDAGQCRTQLESLSAGQDARQQEGLIVSPRP